MKLALSISIAIVLSFATGCICPASAQSGGTNSGYTHSDLPVYVCDDGTSNCANTEPCTDPGTGGGVYASAVAADREPTALERKAAANAGGVCPIAWPKLEIVLVPCPPPLWPRIKICFIYVRVTPPASTALLASYTVADEPWWHTPALAGEQRWAVSLQQLQGTDSNTEVVVSRLQEIERRSRTLTLDGRFNPSAYNAMVRSTTSLRRDLMRLLDEQIARGRAGTDPDSEAETVAAITELVDLVWTLSDHLLTVQTAATRHQRR